MNISVIYLLREQDAVEPFLLSYMRHYAGIEHNLVILTRNNNVILPPQFCEYPLHKELFFTFGLDLDAYRYAAEKCKDSDWLLFMNSYSKIWADDWLRKLADVTSDEVGLIGTSWSVESFYSNNPTWWRKILFPPHPNFHIRTNLFMIRRDILLKTWPRWFMYKWFAYLFESGHNSMTQRVQSLGYRVEEVVDAPFSDNRKNFTCGIS